MEKKTDSNPGRSAIRMMDTTYLLPAQRERERERERESESDNERELARAAT